MLTLAWFTLGLENETMVCDTYIFFRSTSGQDFQIADDRQSDTFDKFRKSNEPIMLKLSYVEK